MFSEDNTGGLKSRQRTESPGPINLFDSTPYEKLGSHSSRGKSTIRDTAPVEGNLGRGIRAGKPAGTSEFHFDWPSEAIKRACEEVFVSDSVVEELPALDWIPDETGVKVDTGTVVHDEMQVDH